MALRSTRRLLLILRPLGLGDFLTAVPALKALAEVFPHHRRVLAAPHALTPLAELVKDSRGMPVVDSVTDAGPLQPLPAQTHGADLAINLHGKGPQSHAVLLQTNPKELWSFANPAVPQSWRGAQWRAGERETSRWCRMLKTFGIEANPGLLSIEPPTVEPPKASLGATLVHPGAASRARRWPPDRWVEVIRSEQAQGRPVVITGSTPEIDLAATIAKAADLSPSALLAGRTDLRELAATVSAASRVVCGDTGVAHLATALATPSVVLFGPCSPAEWGPPTSTPHRHRVLWPGTTGNPRADHPDAALLAITPAEVIAALSKL